MIRRTIVCDECRVTTLLSADEVLPLHWLALSYYDARTGMDTDQHFCSQRCLALRVQRLPFIATEQDARPPLAPGDKIQ